MEYPDDEEEMTELDANSSAQPKPELPKGCITVSINLDDYLRGGTLEEMICESISTKLMHQIKPEIQKVVQQTIQDAAKGEFQQLAKAQLEEYFTKPHKKTDSWGNETGSAVVLQDMFADLFKQYLKQKVNDKGSEENYSNSTDRVSWMLRTIAIGPLNEAIKQQVEAIAAEAKKQVQGMVTRYITEQLTPTMPAVPLLPNR